MCGNLTGEIYLNLLEEFIYLLITELVENSTDQYGNLEFDEHLVHFQQDLTTVYWLIVRNCLHGNFPDRWIGRKGPNERPAKSPDLTLIGYFSTRRS